MYLDYSKLEFDANGIPETPELMLQTMSGDALGTIAGAHNIKLNIKFSEPSEISFDVPAAIGGARNRIYDLISGYMMVFTKEYGVYIIMNPTIDSDGISEIKHVTGYSIEKALESKRFFLEDGTYKFYDETDSHNKDTVIGRILEIAVGWEAGVISPTIAQKYRTFEQYDDYLLSFIYGKISESYRGVVVFDPYRKTINVYDADEDLQKIPIYLDFDNLLNSVSVSELSDEIATAVRPFGADDLDIVEVNPIGSQWLYDISYFISKGDIPKQLAEKWNAWQQTIITNLSYYESLWAMRASLTAKLESERAALKDLDGELENLVGQQSVYIQGIALEKEKNPSGDGEKTQQQHLDEVNALIAAKRAEIAEKEAEVSLIESQLDEKEENSYAAKISAIVNELKIRNYFSEEEYRIISNYLIEKDVSDDTFVATDIDTATSGNNFVLSNGSIEISDSKLQKVDIVHDFGRTMYMMAGGKFSLSGDYSVEADIIRGSLDVDSGNTATLSLYVGSVLSNGARAPSGVLTIIGTAEGIASNIAPVISDEVTSYEGSAITFSISDGSLYLTANISEYQTYAVRKELYEFGVKELSDLATPVYEFSVESGNFVFEQHFKPFRDKLQLGKGVYLNIGNDEVITPYIIEIGLDFEDRSKFSLVFSNRFKRKDNVNTFKDMLDKSYSSSRRFDTNKHTYNQVSNQATKVSQFMNSALDAAANAILAAANQSVRIDGSGISIGGKSGDQIRIVNSMIAMSDNNWSTSSLAIGRFLLDSGESFFGINADVIGGKMIVGNNLVLENETDDGVMQFKVDSSGAWLNNSSLVFQKDNGGKIIIDPKWGVLGGTANLFSTNGTNVVPSFVDEDGGAVLMDDDGMPQNTNFFLDINDGKAYFRGSVTATGGDIGGFTIEESLLSSGGENGYVAINGSQDNTYSTYAMWVGDTSPYTAPFWIKKDGEIKATNGTFSGTLSAAKFTGSLSAAKEKDENGEVADAWLEGCGIKVGANSESANGYNFFVDPKGNVTMNGNITLDGDIKLKYGSITWNHLGKDATNKVKAALNAANDATTNIAALADGSYYGGSFINGDCIISPKIYAIDDPDNYLELTAGALKIYQEGSENTPKVSISYGSGGATSVSMELGNNNPAFVKKNYNSDTKESYSVFGMRGSYMQVNESGSIIFHTKKGEISVDAIIDAIKS